MHNLTCGSMHCVLMSEAVLGADVAGLQREDGSFAGDEWGEVDTRSVA